MPLYLYRCESCGHEIEIQRTVDERDKTLYCPRDPYEGKTRMHRVPTTAGFVVNGFSEKNGYSK